MTDASPFKIQTDVLLTPSTSLVPIAPASANGFSPVPDHGEEEEFSTIKCICGFNDDDGNTVFCEECNTWQHIECYYPRADGADASEVPDVHECTDCRPRFLDATEARGRQARQRLPLASKAKRAVNKSQKRRIKDPQQTNGVRGPDGRDRASGSPRDQAPTAKRPKTSHKSSSSSHSANPAIIPQQRRRTGSTAAATGKSPAKRLPSPSGQCPYFSPEFLQLYKKDRFTLIHANSYASIAVSNDLSSWLTDPESLSKVTSKSHHEIFQRWDRPIEELEATSPGFVQHWTDGLGVTIDSLQPSFKWIIVKKDVGPGSYIGELKGQIGRKQDYTEHPANRWAELRHPAPFVFFLDTLPLYIDSRSEGTDLRYIRRSCNPNVKIQIVVLGTEYHFCLVSIKDIYEGEEISLGWTLDDKPFEIVREWNQKGNMSDDDEAYMCAWTGRVLANFGGCACGRSNNCLLCRFDRRMHPDAQRATTDKSVKLRKGKKTGAQISPLSTGKATNSRAGSEAIINGDGDEDAIDTRSVSASSKSKQTSRDITPTVGFGVEMSDRERRKILQQERLFEQLEHEEQQGGKKKKRNSAGSTLNTPSATTACVKQHGFPDSSNASPTGSNAGPRSNGISVHVGKPLDSRTNPALNVAPPRVKPVYIDATTQTEDPEPTPSAAAHIARIKRSRGSHAQRLLKRAEDERRRRATLMEDRRKSAPGRGSSPISLKEEMGTEREASASMPPPPLPPSAQGARVTSPLLPKTPQSDHEDVEMVDVQVVEPAPVPASNGTTHTKSSEDFILHDDDSPVQLRPPPPPPPLASATTTPVPESPTEASTPKTPDLVQAQLPPPSAVSSPPPPPPPSIRTPTTPTVVTTAVSITGVAIAQSPSTITMNPPQPPPSATANVPPSSNVKSVKRTSLSNYMSRFRQGKEKAAAVFPANEPAIVGGLQSPASASPPPASLTSSSSVAEVAAISLPPARPQDSDNGENPTNSHGHTEAEAAPA